MLRRKPVWKVWKDRRKPKLPYLLDSIIAFFVVSEKNVTKFVKVQVFWYVTPCPLVNIFLENLKSEINK
jgi:hypothetical protein